MKLFFTLSGFLITGILLRARDEAQHKSRWRLRALGRFYVRRFLRIFPLYYFVVGVAFAVNLKPVRDLILWLVTYTLNIHMARQGWYEDHVAHFWTLAVEEQFYIFWPWLALLLPRKLLIPAAVGMVATGPLYRLSYVLSRYHNMSALSVYISTFSSLDSLGMGALLAMVMHAYPRNVVLDRCIRRWGMPLAGAAVVVHEWMGTDVSIVMFDTVEAVVFCALIYCAAEGFRGPLGRLLEWMPLRYIGKISYGLYVYHPLMPVLAVFLLGLTGMSVSTEYWRVSVLSSGLAFVAASASWHLLEKPCNDLKRFLT